VLRCVIGASSFAPSPSLLARWLPEPLFEPDVAEWRLAPRNHGGVDGVHTKDLEARDRDDTVLVVSGPGLFGRLANSRFLAGGKLRSRDTSHTRGPWESAADEREARPSHAASIVAVDLDHDADSLDASAGSEFLDDRIRLPE